MEEEKIDVRSYLDVITRRKWLVLAVFVACMVSTLYYTHRTAPVYESEATILVRQAANPLLGASLFQGAARGLTDHCLILRSDALMQKVLDSVAPEELKELGQERTDLHYLLKYNLSVSPIKDSNIIEIKAQAPSPALAALMANRTAEAYIQYSLEDKRREVSGVRGFVERQLKVVAANLADSEEGLRAYKKEHRLIGVDEKASEVVDRLAQFEASYKMAEVERSVLEEKLKLVENRLSEEEKEVLTSAADLSVPVVARLKTNLIGLENQKGSLLIQGYSEDDPKVKELEDKIDKTRGSLREALTSMLDNRGQLDPVNRVEQLLATSLSTQLELEIQRAKSTALRDVITAYEKEIYSLPDKELAYARLSRAKVANEKIYMMLLEKAEEARVSEAGEIGNIRMLDPAKESSWSIKPSKRRNSVMGILLGLFLGIGFAFVLEYTDVSVKCERDVEKAAGLPVLAYIPLFNRDGTFSPFKKGTRETHPDSSLITHQSPKSAVCEAYRTLRTGVIFPEADRHLKTLLVTSPEPLCGKTVSTANLGITLANAGGSTLIVDSDLRKPSLTKLFKLGKEAGLSNVLVGRSSLDDVVKATDVEHLSIIPCGAVPPNPAELLGSKTMKALIKKLESRYDFVIFDSPPLVGLTDGSVLGSMMDGVVLVVDHGRTSKGVLSRTKKLMDGVGADVLGVVLNKIDVKKGGYGYKYYRYYEYYDQHYGENGGKKRKKGKRGKRMGGRFLSSSIARRSRA